MYSKKRCMYSAVVCPVLWMSTRSNEAVMSLKSSIFLLVAICLCYCLLREKDRNIWACVHFSVYFPYNSISLCLSTRCYIFGITSSWQIDTFVKWSLCLIIVFALSISLRPRIIAQWWDMSLACPGFSPQHPKSLNQPNKNLPSRQECFSSQQAEAIFQLSSQAAFVPPLTGFISWKSFSLSFHFLCLLQAGEQIWSLLFYLGWKQRSFNSIFLLKHCFSVCS